MNACRSNCNQGRDKCPDPTLCQFITHEGGEQVDTDADWTTSFWDFIAKVFLAFAIVLTFIAVLTLSAFAF